MLRHARTVFAFVLTLSLVAYVTAAPPKVIITSPDNGEVDVDPALKEVRVEYDQPMDADGRSVLGGGPTALPFDGDPKFVDAKTFVIPVKLQPDHEYFFHLNSDTFKGFANKKGEAAEGYTVSFKTRSAGAAPAEPDVTAEQNKDALAELKRAIDENYAYRDRKKVDWAKEIEKRRAKFEAARSANEFARLTAHLLRLAEDAHVTVKAGDLHLGTRANSASPNYGFDMLKKSVPGWKEHDSGIVSGRFNEGVGYILFSDCSPEQADGFDKALDELKDVKAGDLHLGTRANSASPNYDFDVLKKSVPGWKEHDSGIVSGRFSEGVGYILFSSCSGEQADGFDKALDELKDVKALILDARPNGGGDESAAERVAGRFVEKPAVYSKNRIREGGKWVGPLDRVVGPRKDAERFAKPVVVLIGPKVGSSAESFVLMMKHGSGARLIGAVTKGSSGRPMPHQLGNGVTVYLSSWEDQLPDGTVLEGRGVRPDTIIKTNLSDFETSDPVLDAAVKLMRRKEPTTTKTTVR